MIFPLKNAPFLDLKGCMFLLHDVFHKSYGINMRNFKELTGKKPTSMSSGKLACFGLGYCWRYEGTEVLIMKLILCSWCHSARILVWDFYQIVVCRMVYLLVQNIKTNHVLSVYGFILWDCEITCFGVYFGLVKYCSWLKLIAGVKLTLP